MRGAWLAVLCVSVCCTLRCQCENTTSLSSEPLVLEAVDLQAAVHRTATADQVQQKEMQDLLHWAIGGNI